MGNKNKNKMMKIAFVAVMLLGVALADVTVLNNDNFLEKTKEGKWFVKFYAPWCGHCKRLAPTWDEFSGKSGDINVAKVDCTTDQAICGQFGVRGYPTLKYIDDSTVYDYSGARSIDAFQKFADGGYKQAASKPLPGTAAKKEETTESSSGGSGAGAQVLTTANFDEKVAEGTWMLKFYAPWCGHCKRLAPEWEKYGKETDINVGKVDCTVEKSVCSKFGVRGYPTLKMVKDGKVYDYSGQRTISAFKSFVDGGYASAPSKDL